MDNVLYIEFYDSHAIVDHKFDDYSNSKIINDTFEKYAKKCLGINVSFSEDFNWKKRVHNSIICDLVNMLPCNVSICIHANTHYQEAVKYCYENISHVKEIELIYGYDSNYDYVSDLSESYLSDNKFKLFLSHVRLRLLKHVMTKIKNKCIFNLMFVSNITEFYDLLLLIDFIENSDMIFFSFILGIHREVLNTESATSLINYFSEQSKKYDNERIYNFIKIFYCNLDFGFLYFLQQYI